ncbi:MAG: LTA synthase family protein [Pseudomonadota bacterium]
MMKRGKRVWPLMMWVGAAFLLVSTATRVGLLAWNASEAGPASGWLHILLVGLGFDLATASLALLPVAIFDLLLPRRWPRLAFAARGATFSIILFSLLFVAASEFVFWDEFGARFNFIAVDYLVYTHEVWDNIRQSYPVTALMSLFSLLALLGMWLMRRGLAASNEIPFHVRALGLAGITGLAVMSWQGWSMQHGEISANRVTNELATNGFYSLFSAFRNNSLDYARYYPRLPEADLRATLNRLKVAPGLFAGQARPELMTVAATPAQKPKHFILITVESLSADFLGAYGDTRQLTPSLDELATQSLLFTNLYAVGTRTVRGLEALSLAVPPTPGQSIVRRPGNEDLVSLASTLNRQGYRSWYVYGGYGYFDNMNYFFSHNGYNVLDRSDVPAQDIGFANAWGMADEYTFQQVERLMDREADRAPQFIQVMTTSNHRPYTYPQGRIDIPSPGGRDGAVKYTDFAIGRFIKAARQKPWFKDAVIVVVADHCASSAGKTSLPVNRYRIPALVYAPGYIKPQRMDRLTSQIDLAPTFLALLGLKPEPRFFGRNIFSVAPGEERALIANYQEVGYLKDKRLVVLAPQRPPRMFLVSRNAQGDEVQTEVAPDPTLVNEAIAYYQGASEAFHGGALKLTPREVRAPVRLRI